jgi:chitinase
MFLCLTSKPNSCDLSGSYNFDHWDNWAQTKSSNKDVKIYIGVPGAPEATDNGYVDIESLKKAALDAQEKYTSFGGVMLWDAYMSYCKL